MSTSQHGDVNKLVGELASASKACTSDASACASARTDCSVPLDASLASVKEIGAGGMLNGLCGPGTGAVAGACVDVHDPAASGPAPPDRHTSL